MSKRIGVDTGGTFTDFVYWADNRWQVYKRLSSPQKASQSVIAGLNQLQIDMSTAVLHGTTVGTNRLLERKGARTALIVTKGFADLLEIGRQNRPQIYELVPRKKESLVPRSLRLEVEERVSAQGEVIQALDPESLVPLIQLLKDKEVESVAVCLLFSFLRAEHEQLIRDALADLKVHISLSSEILPEYREYERCSTTVINAYIAPVMRDYLSDLKQGVGERPLSVMQSNGGMMSIEAASREAGKTILSGPAGGVLGAYRVGVEAGFTQLISFDMGGTSSDVALCPGKLPLRYKGQIDQLAIHLPSLHIHTVGAGGGSIARLDFGGALQVGPESAGGFPGPVAYGRGGEEVTVTDANLILGRLDSAWFLGGQMKLKEGLAREKMGLLAHRLGEASVELTAVGILAVANAHMERAIRKISIEEGHDPRLFTLVAFGGAGPLHGCELAEMLQIPRVLIPPTAGVLSALGIVQADPTKDFAQTILLPLHPKIMGDRLIDAYNRLTLDGRSVMEEEGYEKSSLVYAYQIDMRYQGQSHELTIPFNLGMQMSELVAHFQDRYQRRYGYIREGGEIEIVTIRLRVSKRMVQPMVQQEIRRESAGRFSPIREKLIWFKGGWHQTYAWERDRLPIGHKLVGPAVVVQYDTTTLLPPGWQLEVDRFGNLICELIGQ